MGGRSPSSDGQKTDTGHGQLTDMLGVMQNGLLPLLHYMFMTKSLTCNLAMLTLGLWAY
jgi:hypothetical protein